jgi:hypothetical protein
MNPLEENRFKEVVNYIRKIYFPQWDKTREWVIKYEPDSPEVEFCLGKCKKDIKTIYIKRLFDNDIELMELLIHEICHVFAIGHGKPWQRRMSKAAEQAAKKGENELSNKLIDEVKRYKRRYIVTAIMIYNQINDIVLDTKGTITFEKLRHYLASEYGGYEVIDAYKKIRNVYDESIKFVSSLNSPGRGFR